MTDGLKDYLKQRGMRLTLLMSRHAAFPSGTPLVVIRPTEANEHNRIKTRPSCLEPFIKGKTFAIETKKTSSLLFLMVDEYRRRLEGKRGIEGVLMHYGKTIDVYPQKRFLLNCFHPIQCRLIILILCHRLKFSKMKLINLEKNYFF